MPGEQRSDEGDAGRDENRSRLQLGIVAVGLQRQPPQCGEVACEVDRRDQHQDEQHEFDGR